MSQFKPDANNFKLAINLLSQKETYPARSLKNYRSFCGTRYSSSFKPGEIEELREIEVTQYSLNFSNQDLDVTIYSLEEEFYSFEQKRYINSLSFTEVEGNKVFTFYDKREFNILVKQANSVLEIKNKLVHLPDFIKHTLFDLIVPFCTEAEKIIFNLQNDYHSSYDCWSMTDFEKDLNKILELKKLEFELAFFFFFEKYPEVKSLIDIFEKENLDSRVMKIDVSVDDDGKIFFVFVFDNFTTKIINLHWVYNKYTLDKN